MPCIETTKAARHCALGNHDFVAFPRKKVIQALEMPSACYTFSAPGWRFIVLDTLNVSVVGWGKSTPNWQAGERILSRLKKEHRANAFSWDGAVGEVQRQWLSRQLSQAAAAREKVIVFGHIPAMPGSCRPDCLLWDHVEVTRLVESCPTPAAYMCGHDHLGGYAVHDGIHYVTYPAMVEHPASDSSFVVDVYSNQFIVRNMRGLQRTQPFPTRLRPA